MLKWLKDRQLGNKVNKKTIYEHISVGHKFKYRSMINYDSDFENGTGWCCSNLKWTRDGCRLATIMSEQGRYYSKRQIITFLDPNTDTGHLVKQNIDLKCSPDKYCFHFIDFQGTKAILSGTEEIKSSDKGCIGIVSTSNGKLEEVIRKGLK